MANTVPLIVLGLLVTARKKSDFFLVTLISGLVSGLGTWAIGGTDTVHIGASGVVFGFLGFLMGRGLFEKKVGSVLLSIGVTGLFGGMLFGALPLVAGPGISWEAHLFGFIGGLLSAKWLSGGRAKRR